MGGFYNPITAYSGSDPRKIAANQRQQVAQQGDYLQGQAGQQYQQGMQQAGATGDYLSGVENPLAQGQGGYNASELSQIQMTPEQQADIVSRAGITAGTATAAGADAAQRAANAAGGNPAAVAAYRARAAQQSGAAAGDAATNARVQASNAAAQRAENIGQTRIGQQNQGLNYYQGLQQMQNQNAQNAAQRQLGAYGTETSGGNQAANLGLQASQTPSTFDKIIGGIGGAVSSFLDQGEPPMRDYFDSGSRPAVVAEGGPEAILKMVSSGARDYLDDGMPSQDQFDSLANPSGTGTGSEMDAYQDKTQNWNGTPFWKQMGQNLRNNLTNPSQGQQSGSMNQKPAQPWNPTDTYKTIGSAAGGLAKLALPFLEHGEIYGDNGAIFTQPTKVSLAPNETAVPLNYRATAKVRPSMAMPLVNQIRNRRMYGAQ